MDATGRSATALVLTLARAAIAAVLTQAVPASRIDPPAGVAAPARSRTPAGVFCSPASVSPKLSETLPHTDVDRCQRCHKTASTGDVLTHWQECDDNDQPTHPARRGVKARRANPSDTRRVVLSTATFRAFAPPRATREKAVECAARPRPATAGGDGAAWRSLAGPKPARSTIVVSQSDRRPTLLPKTFPGPTSAAGHPQGGVYAGFDQEKRATHLPTHGRRPDHDPGGLLRRPRRANRYRGAARRRDRPRRNCRPSATREVSLSRIRLFVGRIFCSRAVTYAGWPRGGVCVSYPLGQDPKTPREACSSLRATRAARATSNRGRPRGLFYSTEKLLNRRKRREQRKETAAVPGRPVPFVSFVRFCLVLLSFLGER